MSKKRGSTPGQRARLYLEAHRDSGMTGLPDEHRQARQDIMSQLERQDPGVRERALVGSDQHFDRRLEKSERSYQQAWQRREGLDVGDVTQRRKDLDRDQDAPKPSGGRRPGTHRRAPISRRGGGRSRIRTITSNTPPAAASIAGIGWELFIAGIAISLLYLILTSSEKKGAGANVLEDALGGVTGAFTRLTDPTNNLFGPATKAAGKAKATARQVAQVGPSKSAGEAIVTSTFGAKLPNYSTSSPIE
jgi:hypothetical protein